MDGISMIENQYTKWVACWGNATSITDQREAAFSKDMTLRYPVKMCFSGKALRFRFSNLTGTEPITITSACVARAVSDREIQEDTVKNISFAGNRQVTIQPGQEISSDEVNFL